MSTTLVGGLFGLLGIVLGTALTNFTSRQTAAWSNNQTRLATQRQELRSAVTQFASALLAYRLAEAGYWSTRHGGKADGKTVQEVYRLRGVTLDGLCVLELSSDDDQLRELARDAVDIAYKIREAGTQAEMGDRTHDVRKAVEQVIAAARAAERNLT